jgi:hypothetical protein
LLPPRAEHNQLNRNLLEAVGANWAGQPNYSRERQLLPADPPDQAESLRALGASCDGEGHSCRFYPGRGDSESAGLGGLTMEAGKVFLPSGAAWLNDYIDELATFPNGSHDDQVDSTTLALNDLRTRGREPGIIAWYRQSLEQQGIKVPTLPPIPAA